jgi:spore germination protein
LIRNVHKLLKKSVIKKKPAQSQQKQEQTPQDKLHPNFNQNVETFRSIFENSSDVVFRSFLLFGKRKAMIIYIEGLSNVEGIEKFVLSPLMPAIAEDEQPLQVLLETKLPISQIKKMDVLADCMDSILTGNPILLCDGEKHALSLGMTKYEKRSIEEPVAEGGIRGSREGFTESVQVGTSLVRRIIKSPSLKIESMKIGRYTKTDIALLYIEGIVDQTLIEEIKNRLNRIEIDGILESEFIEELIEDDPHSPFPQILSTERPDIVCSNLLEGRAAILVDGTPFSLIAPISFFSLLQSHEDYYHRSMVSTFIRWLRHFFLALSLLLPSLYIAILTFHQEMIPSKLLLSITASRETVPFPAFLEALMMEIMFEALREAGIRLPKQIGSAVSIVGALVIGQAAVQAGLVSAPMVIVVAVTGIASFMIPRYAIGISIRVLRFPIMLLAATLGLLGITIGVIIITIHLCTLRSFGVPYLSPLAPLKTNELNDALWRSPLWKMNKRPRLTGDYNENRQSSNQKPNSKKGGETK